MSDVALSVEKKQDDAKMDSNENTEQKEHIEDVDGDMCMIL